MAKKKKEFYCRQWLNRPGFQTHAHVLAEIERHIQWDGLPSVSASFAIADCSRIVDLDFNMNSKEDKRNALHKARLLRTIVNDFVDALETASEGVGDKKRGSD